MTQFVEHSLASLLTKNLSLLNHANVFNSRNRFFGRKEVLESKHRSRSFLDKPMILFNNVVQILVLPDFNLFIFWQVFVKRIKGCLIASTFININFIRRPIFLESLSEKSFCRHSIPFCSKEKINRAAKLVNGSVKVNPLAIQLEWSKKR